MHETYFLAPSGPKPQKCNICFPDTAACAISPWMQARKTAILVSVLCASIYTQISGSGQIQVPLLFERMSIPAETGKLLQGMTGCL